MNENISKNPILFGIFATKPHKKWAIFAITVVFIAVALSRFLVIVLQNLTNSLTTQPFDLQNVWFWALGYPLVYFTAECFYRLSGFSGMHWFTGMQATCYQRLYEYVSFHSKDYFDNRFAGSITNKITNASDGNPELFGKMLWNFFPIALGLCWYTIFAWLGSWQLGLIIVIWSSIFFGINTWFVKKLDKHSYKYAQSASVLKGKLVDSLSNISLVHEYACVGGEQEYVGRFVKNQYDAGIKRWTFSEWLLVLNGTMISLFMFLMIGSSVYLYQIHIVTIGVVVMVTVIVLDLGNSLFFIGQEMVNASRLYGQVKEGLEEVLQKHLILDSKDASILVVSKGAIAIQSIFFEYENTGVFKNFSLDIPSGQKIGLVGRSGAGKTTLVSLLLRHFDIQKGAIKIDGQDIKDVTLESLRKVIAIVPQDTSLFHRTIKENIRYSNPNATDEEVRKAAKQAQADEFIEKLPKGYETLVGERGVKLSGGQRQRIAIARAFLKNAPILILDEATSSLDSESESLIQISLEQLMKGRTVIAIAHRLSTLKEMDRLVVVKNGRIVEDGSFEKLLQKEDGEFKNMWNHQISGFIVDD